MVPFQYRRDGSGFSAALVLDFAGYAFSLVAEGLCMMVDARL